MTEHRAVVDGEIRFSNGGSIAVEGFRLDLAGPHADRDTVGQLLVQSLGLLMADEVSLSSVEVVEEPHKGTRGGPSDADPGSTSSGVRRLVELSHRIRAGMVTLPGLPGPEISVHLTRDASKATYAEGTTFEIGRISMVANTGTYVDAPHHRFEEGVDLAGVPLEKLADLDAVVVRVLGSAVRAIDVETLLAHDVRGKAVLLHTGDASRFGSPEYVVDPAFLTRAGAAWLVSEGAALVGIDAANIDDMTDGERPAHTQLLAAGIPIVEHLRGLEDLPPLGARFTAVPPLVEDFGTFPVRAFAAVPA
jgi:arylformamidase